MSARQVIAGVLGATAVALGAFGAHGLKEILQKTPEASQWWNTATQYLLIHAIAIGAIESARSTYLWMSGAIIFSSTLYLMAVGGPRWLGAVTPVGGTLLIAGWVMLALRKK